MKWSEAKEKSADKTWAFLELRPTGKVVSKEQYEYVLYYAKQTGIDTRYIRTFEEEKGKYLRLEVGSVEQVIISILQIRQRE